MPNLTPRLMLQLWGTEVCRNGFHDDIWIASVENKLRTSKDNVVISDCRFPNEIQSIKNAGGAVIRVTRGKEPEWYEFAEIVNKGATRNLKWASNKAILDNFKIHASETAWVGTEFDYVLDNNGTIDELFNQVKAIVNPESDRPDAT